jgi:hypothetical protein
MVLQNYQNLIEMTSNIIYIVAYGVGFKCPRKIHLKTQWGGGCSPGSAGPKVLVLMFNLDLETIYWFSQNLWVLSIKTYRGFFNNGISQFVVAPIR